MSHFTLTSDPINGPTLNVVVAVSAPRAEALQGAGEEIPAAQTIRGLVDTGASGTCIHPDVLKALNLTPTGTTLVYTPSTGDKPVEALQYDVGLMIPGATAAHQPLLRLTIPVIASRLPQQGIEALIGRDVLRSCVLVYNGQEDIFTLAY